MSDEPRSAGPGGLLELPLVVLDEALEAVPRLLSRTRRQVDLARRLAGHVPCLGGLLAAPREPVPVPAHEVTPVDVLSVVAAGDPVSEDGTDRVDGPVRTVDATPAPATGDAGPDPDEDVPASAELPVPDYDALAASQVVPRLATLSPDELQAVRAYERSHRNRQTILSRVAQLLDG